MGVNTRHPKLPVRLAKTTKAAHPLTDDRFMACLERPAAHPGFKLRQPAG
jgi:hypothetical protein